jgi:hypothetical protein
VLYHCLPASVSSDYGLDLHIVHSLAEARSEEHTGALSYDSIVLLAGGTPKQYRLLLGFVDSGGHVLIGLGSAPSAHTRAFLSSCGIYVGPNATNVVDHSSYLNIIDDR